MDCHHALCPLRRNGGWSEGLGSTLASYEGVDQLMRMSLLYLLGCGVNWFNGCKYSTQKSNQALKLYVCLNCSLSRNSLRAPWQSIHNRFTLILAIHCFPQKIKQINEGNQSLKRSEHIKQNRELSLLIKSLRYSCENPKYDLLTPQIQKKNVSSLDSLILQMAKCPVFVKDIWRFEGNIAAREESCCFIKQHLSASLIPRQITLQQKHF